MDTASQPANDAIEEADFAVQKHVRDRIVRLIDVSDISKGGSAVKICIDGHYFLATAAHVIPDDHDIRALIPGGTNHFMANFVRRLTDDACDVGLLEISANDATSFGGAFVSTDELLLRFDHEPSAVAVVGYPGQLIESGDETILASTVARVHNHHSLMFVSRTLPISEWPIELSRPPSPTTDVFASFNPDSQMTKKQLIEIATPAHDFDLKDLQLEGMSNLKLEGISGGGIWRISSGNASSEIWHPNLQLIAIDVSYSTTRKIKWLRGTLIDKWLDLVLEHYPDLNGAIREPRN